MKISARDNRGRSSFKANVLNGLIFVDTSYRDNWGSFSFQVTSSKLPYFCKNFSL